MRPFSTKIQPTVRTARLIDVSVAEMTLLGPTRPMDDASFDLETTRLAARARAGDTDAFSALIEIHHRAARRVALAALGNLADADEAVQDACFTAWRRISHLEDPAAFRAWLLRITWRKALDRRRSVVNWFRRLHRERSGGDRLAVIPAPTESADASLIARERDRAVEQLIRALPARLRDPFLLAASGEHRYEEIASLLGIPLGTVKWQISEARRVLREKLQRMGFGDVK
jgi:RNA polymerase sigma-70 factor, ECF subfamily